VVFGRAAAKRAAELVKPGTPHEKISNSETEIASSSQIL